MATKKRPTFVIHYRFSTEEPWEEYNRTMVPAIRDHYLKTCSIEFPTAIVKQDVLKK